MLTCPRCRNTYPEGTHVCPVDGVTLLPDAALGAGDQDLAEGEMVGEYRIEALVGRGGFGAVYRATHPVIGKAAAIKVLSRQYSSNPEMVARFVAEARAVNRIGHKNIVDIFSFGTTPDGRQYYVMELLEGQPLDAYLSERGPLGIEEAMPILKGIARAVDAAHAAGIAHRDLKPANIFLSFDDDRPFPKLLDFGIAKLLPAVSGDAAVPRTQTGAPMGTPHYMSPEQCRGAAVDQRTDVYSFGVMVHEMLTGSLPFFKESQLELMMEHLTARPPRLSERAPELPAALDEPVLRMLEKDPEKRPSTLGEAVRDLAVAAQTAGFTVEVPSVQEGRPVSGARSGPVARISTKGSGVSGDAATLLDTDAQGTLAAQAVAATGSRGRFRAALVVVLSVFGVAVVVAVRGMGRGAEAVSRAEPPPSPVHAEAPAAPMPGAPASTPAASPAPTATAVASAPAVVTLTIASIPESLDVVVGGTKVGRTPGPVSLPRGTTPVSVTFQAEGYVSKTSTVIPSEDRALSVTLTPARKSAARSASRRKATDLEF
jgi:serine/threonine-protein kinase